MSDQELIDAAKDFATKYGDLVGITQAELLAGTFKKRPSESPRVVELYELHIVKGYEAYRPPVNRIASYRFFLGADGSVRRVVGSSWMPSSLTLCVLPPSGGQEPAMLRSIVGAELVYQKPAYAPTPALSVGRAARADIRASVSTIVETIEQDGTQRFRNGWITRVERGGHAWRFTVDAVTGEQLSVAGDG